MLSPIVLLGQCIHDIATAHGLMISLFLVGLVGGVTHCVGMCGPFVLAQCGDSASLKKISSSLLLPYHMGRMTTYVTLAVLLGAVLNLAFLFSGLKTFIAAPLLVLAAVIFLINAFPRLAVLFPWAGRVRLGAPQRLISKLSAPFMNNPNALQRYGLGVLLGFMPCGLVISALMASSTASSALGAGAAMAAFTFGTMPALVLVALGGGVLKAKYPRAAKRLSQGAMALSSLWLFILAGSIVLAE